MRQSPRTLFLTSAVSICLLPVCTQAHMQMSWPYALRSPLDPEVPESLKDYSITNPLLADGSDFSCKNYQYNETNPQANDIKAVYQAGSEYNMTISGTATHLGGSCQISLSYDNGATFKVIESQIGGCSLVPTHNFTIPSYAPSSDSVLLSWTWFNLVGNREMYQSCARVSIQNPNQDLPTRRYSRRMIKREASLDDLPNMFVCNVGNGCTTIERSEVVFPEPGNDVVYGEDAVTPSSGPGFKLASPSTASGNSAAAAAVAAAVAASHSSSSLSLTASSTAPFPNTTQATATATATPTTTPAPAAAAAAANGTVADAGPTTTTGSLYSSTPTLTTLITSSRPTSSEFVPSSTVANANGTSTCTSVPSSSTTTTTNNGYNSNFNGNNSNRSNGTFGAGNSTFPQTERTIRRVR